MFAERRDGALKKEVNSVL